MSRDYKKEYAEYHSKPEQKKNRAKRNKANRNSNCSPGQEVDHKVPLSAGGSNSPSNWRVVSKETNRKKGSKKMSSFDNLRLAIEEKTAAPEGVERLPSGGLKYRDEVFPGYNKPKSAPKGSKHKKRVLAKKGDKVKVVNFGARGYKHNYSAKAKKSYLARSAGIKGKDDKFSANYWSRRELWPKNQKADGSAKKRKKTASFGKALGYGLGGTALAGAATGAMGDRGAYEGAKNTLSNAASGTVTGAGMGSILGGLGMMALTRGKYKGKTHMGKPLTGLAGVAGAGVGAAAGGATGMTAGYLKGNYENLTQPKTASLAGALGQMQAKSDMEAAGLTPKQINEVSTIGGGALRGLGRELGYTAGGTALGALLGGGLGAITGYSPVDKPYLSNPALDLAGNMGIGGTLGGLAGGLYGMYRGYQGERELAEEAIKNKKKRKKRKKTASADNDYNTSNLESFIFTAKR